MKILTATLLVLFAATAFAEVLVVNIWKPYPGQAGNMLQAGQEARAIVESLGGEVVLGTDQMGQMHFGVSHADWAAWADFQAKMLANEQWQSFWNRVSANPPANLEHQYMMNQPAPGGVGSVYQVFIWKAFPGRQAEMMEVAMGAKPLHEKLGANVGINVDQYGRLHYLVGFANWEEWGKFQAAAAASKEWNEYWNPRQSNPSAELQTVYMGTRVPGG